MGNLSFLATSDGASLAYRLDGAAEKPLLALSNPSVPPCTCGMHNSRH